MGRKLIGICTCTLVIISGLSGFFGIITNADPIGNNYYEDEFSDSGEWVCTGDLQVLDGYLRLTSGNSKYGTAAHDGYIDASGSIYKVKVL